MMMLKSTNQATLKKGPWRMARLKRGKRRMLGMGYWQGALGEKLKQTASGCGIPIFQSWFRKISIFDG
jgi:hypothetical protein